MRPPFNVFEKVYHTLPRKKRAGPSGSALCPFLLFPLFAGLVRLAGLDQKRGTMPTVDLKISLRSTAVMLVVVGTGAADLFPGKKLLIFHYRITSTTFYIISVDRGEIYYRLIAKYLWWTIFGEEVNSLHLFPFPCRGREGLLGAFFGAKNAPNPPKKPRGGISISPLGLSLETTKGQGLRPLPFGNPPKPFS